MIYNFKPSKKYGQNFLTNIKISEKIVTALDPESRDIVLEIGAGLGSLTQILVEKSLRRLIVLETDLRCVEILTEKFNDVCAIGGRIVKIRGKAESPCKRCQGYPFWKVLRSILTKKVE